ncbi:MAG: DUF721 domain-containing protein [Acidobacteriota bacterium]|nr:DUF721 domain-containing protein [Acidobacteriota bacterium]
MDKLINTIPAILAASGSAEEVAEAACIVSWKHAVGEALSSQAVPLKFVADTLVVAVADRIWQKQLEQMQSHLLYRLNSVLGQPLVKSIEFRIDADTFKSIARVGGESGEPSARQGSAAIPIELLSAAAAIDDAGLRKAFLGAALSCVRRTEQS